MFKKIELTEKWIALLILRSLLFRGSIPLRTLYIADGGANAVLNTVTLSNVLLRRYYDRLDHHPFHRLGLVAAPTGRSGEYDLIRL